MDMKRVYLAFCIILVLLTLILIASSVIMMSCSRNETTGFKEFVVSEGLASFSFEYPAFCYVPYVDRSREPHYTEVKTGGVIQPGVGGDEHLFIRILQTGNSFENAEAMLEDNLARAEEHQDFQLLERSSVNISGIQGEQIIYSYFGYHSTWESEAETGTAYKAYFDYEGLIWRVVMLADEYAAAERARADFEHVLETFQVLD